MFTLSFVWVKAIEPPVIQCIHLNINATDVQVSWTHPNNYVGLSTIQIWLSEQPDGPFVLANTVIESDPDNLVCSIQISLDSLFGPNVNTLYSYLCATPNAAHILEGNAYSDTMRSMSLTVTPVGENPTQNSRALLTWTSPDPFPPASSNRTFDIFKKREGDLAETYVTSVNSNTHTYVDTADICDGDVSYYVRIFNYALNPACQISTKVKTAHFSDATPPKVPTLDSVSVNHDQQLIELGWRQHSSDAIGCIIYHSTNAGGPWPPIDTVLGTHWQGPHNGSETHYYRIASIDRCFGTGQTIAGNMTNTYQGNMILSNPGTDACRKQIKLQWTPYVNMTNEVGLYRIYYSDDNGPLLLLDSTDAATTSYTCQNLPVNHRYTFIVQAVNQFGNITASSSKCLVENYDDISTLDLCYLCHASVHNENTVEVKVLTSGDTLPFTEVYFYRSINDNSNFSFIGSVPYQQGVAKYYFVDNNVDVQNSINYYKASIVNQCGAESAVSNIGHTVLLKGDGEASQENYLQWNNYSQFEGGTDSYTVYRKVEINPDYEVISIGQTAMDHNEFSDDVTELFQMGSAFRYYVVANEGVNRFGFADTSRSNTIEVKQYPNTFIPNAFRPTGTIIENQVFKPANSFMNTEGYKLTIYSRQGEIVFTTTDITEGWNGKDNTGQHWMPAGMYVYRLQYTDLEMKLHVRSGTVMMIR